MVKHRVVTVNPRFILIIFFEFVYCSSCCPESQREAALLLGQFASTDSDCKVLFHPGFSILSSFAITPKSKLFLFGYTRRKLFVAIDICRIFVSNSCYLSFSLIYVSFSFFTSFSKI